MSIRKKLVSLLGTTMIAAAIMFVAGGATEVQAASYTVTSTTGDVTGEVGSTVKVPIHISSAQDLRGLSGKLNGNYDSSVLQFEGMSPEGIPEAVLTSTAGGNFSYLTSKNNTFKSGTLNLEFKVLKCTADPVSVTIKNLYYTDGNESSDMVDLTAKVTINHPTDKRVETVAKEPTCTEKGTKSVKCGECGADLGTEEIPALGHTAGDWKVTKEATCTEKGSEQGRRQRRVRPLGLHPHPHPGRRTVRHPAAGHPHLCGRLFQLSDRRLRHAPGHGPAEGLPRKAGLPHRRHRRPHLHHRAGVQLGYRRHLLGAGRLGHQRLHHVPAHHPL